MLIDKILAMLGAFLLLSVVGFGPALVLTSSAYNRRILVSAALAPALGLIVIAFPLYFLFLLGMAVGQSALPVTIGGIILSTLLLILDWRRHRQDYKNAVRSISRLRLASIIIGWLVILYFLLLSAIIGGTKFQFYQGNYWDATNYVLMSLFDRDFSAKYVQNETYYDEIVQHNPTTLPMSITGLANLRPSVSHLLAWQSVLFNQPAISLYYFEKLLSFLITAALAAALAYQFGLGWWQQLALMFVSAVGFWAVFVSDIDALSQIYALPLSLLVIFAFVQFEREGRHRLFSRHRWLLALALAALICFYPEIILQFIPAIALYYVLEFSFNPSRSTLKIIGQHSITVLMIVLFLNIMLSPLLHFAQSQSQFAILDQSSIVWAKTFFPWLFYRRNALFGLWGLGNLIPESNGALSPEVVKAALLMTLFIVITAVVGKGVLKGLTSRLTRPESRFLAILIVVYWGGGLLLFLIANDWVAGKSLAMGAPFVVLGIFAFFRDYFSYPNLLNKLLQMGLVVWVVVQALTLPLRAWAITGGIVLPQTVTLTQTAFSDAILPIVDRLKQENVSQVGLDLGTSKYPFEVSLAVSISDIVPIVYNGEVTSYLGKAKDPIWMTTDTAPDHLVVVDSRDYLKPLGLGQSLITVPADSFVNGEKYVTVYAVKPDDYDQALYRSDILIPDVPSAPISRGLDAAFIPDKGSSFARWMVNDTSEIHFISGISQELGIYVESRATYTGNMDLEFNGASAGTFLTKTTPQMQSNSSCVTTKTGSNILKFIHRDTESKDKNRVLVSKLLFAPVNTLDIGTIGDDRQVGSGWEAQENWGEETIRWAGQDSRLQIMTCGGVDEQELHFRAFLPQGVESQNVTIDINGTEVGTIELTAGWKEYTVAVANNLLKTAGLQAIEIRHSKTFVPTSDTRTLSAAYDRFWFTNNHDGSS